MAGSRCAECGRDLRPSDLARPGFRKRDCPVDDTDVAVAVEDSLNLKGRHQAPGEVKPYLRTTVKREWSPSGGLWEEVTHTFDSDARVYRETYRNLETGEITFQKEGAIDDQGLHGPGDVMLTVTGRRSGRDELARGPEVV
jgi:hypothetical protein